MWHVGACFSCASRFGSRQHAPHGQSESPQAKLRALLLPPSPFPRPHTPSECPQLSSKPRKKLQVTNKWKTCRVRQNELSIRENKLAIKVHLHLLQLPKSKSLSSLLSVSVVLSFCKKLQDAWQPTTWIFRLPGNRAKDNKNSVRYLVFSPWRSSEYL